MDRPNIKSIESSGTFEEVFADSTPDIQAIGRTLRALLAQVLPGLTEVPWGRQKTIGYGVGPKKMSEHFCYLAPFKGRVNLGFFYGADLYDPEDLLEGNGKLLRHIKVDSLHQLENPAIRQLVEEASTHLPKLKKGGDRKAGL